MAVLMSGCTNQTAPVVSSVDKTEECMNINKKLIKIDRFLTVVNNTSAFHLEEAAAALESPGITESNNKKQMLRDGNKKKTALLDEQEKLGCAISKK